MILSRQDRLQVLERERRRYLRENYTLWVQLQALEAQEANGEAEEEERRGALMEISARIRNCERSIRRLEEIIDLVEGG